MPVARLASDHIKDSLTQWLTNALKCELFPREGDSIANAELPDFAKIEARLATRAMGDDTHVIRAITKDGDVYSITVKLESRCEK